MSSGSFGQAGPSVTGRMGEQGGLRTGWLAAFGTEGYEGEPPLLEELGVNFGHIKVKVSKSVYLRRNGKPTHTSCPVTPSPAIAKSGLAKYGG